MLINFVEEEETSPRGMLLLNSLLHCIRSPTYSGAFRAGNTKILYFKPSF